MGKYTAFLSKRAQKQLDKLPDKVANRIITAISDLELDLRPEGSKKLRGRDGYRVRRGKYRNIYEIFDDQHIVDVIALGHRMDIYD